jgi:hypothetical protein
MPLFDNLPDEIEINEEESQEAVESTQLPDEVEVETTEQEEVEQESVETEEPNSGEEQIQEPETNTEPEDSSLTSEPQEPTENQEEIAELEITEDQLFTTLSEKLGREVSSWEDLNTQAETEDPFEGDPELKAIAEWKKKTGRPISEWSQYQKDYSTMPEEDVVREHLRHTYPDFTEEEIELEMQEYVADEDLDTDRDAARKRLRLKKEAVKARRELNEFKTTFETPVQPNVPKEYEEAMSFYRDYQDKSTQSQNATKALQEGINSQVESIKSIPLQLSEESSINLNLSKEETQELPKLITETPHWFNQDGSYNYEAIVKDAAKMKHFDRAVKAAYEQGKNEGIELEDKDSRNVDFSKARSTNTAAGNEEIIIEGADDMLNGGRLMFG